VFGANTQYSAATLSAYVIGNELDKNDAATLNTILATAMSILGRA
jgi:hypothetical protein